MGDIHRFLVEVEIPDGVTITEMTAAINTAVRCIPGYYTDESYMFDMDKESVKTTHATKVRLENAWRKLKIDVSKINGV